MKKRNAFESTPVHFHRHEWWRRMFVGLLATILAVAALPAAAQVSLSLQGAAQAVNCDTLTLTSRVQNAGATVANLWLTNQLPPSGYYYVPGASTVSLPGGVVLTGAAADPTNNLGGTNLGWDFSAVVTPSLTTNLLITEVYYDPTNTAEDAYEWFEIYNPSTNIFAITNWSIKDALPGSVDVLPDLTLAPGEFVIVAASTSAFFSVYPAYPGQVVQVADGALGSGLNNAPGDGLFLRNAASNNVDAMSYGGSTAAFNPPVPFAPQGYSLVRNPANNDSNTRNDWTSTNTPTPGSGSVPVGLQNGGVITVVWLVEVSCEAVSGQFLSYASFEQPPGTKGTSTVSKFVTVSRPDLVVTKTPTLQEGGYGDFVTWTVRVENAGFGAAPNVTLTDNLGSGLLFDGFSINPTNGVVGSNVTWDATVIPAFTSLNAGAFVDIVVTAQVVACEGLFNAADATWRCAGLLAATNAVCEDTANNGQTATATLQFNDRHPSLSGSLSLTNLAVPYCGNLNVTLYLTNATGSEVGAAGDIELFASMPDGWSYSAPTNIGILLPGQSTSVVVTVIAGGACPMSTEPDAVFFYPYYFDGCDQYFYGPVLFVPAAVVNPPSASVTKQMPSSAYTTFPVTVRFSYTNFSGTEVVTLTDVYPQNTNLSVASISPAGALSSTTIVWTLSGMSGSGVRTTSFDMVYGSACGGPNTLAFNTLQASSYTDCRGCVRPVAGSGVQVPIRLTPAPSCPFDGGTNGGGDCYFYGVKSVSAGLTEACVPVTLTHTFTNFGGADLTNWTGVVFSSDLAGGQGVLGSTADVQVVVNGSNVTSAVSITQTNPSLIVALAGLNNTIYSNLTLVTNGLSISWTVSASPGQMVDRSTLLVPPCGESTEWAQWNVGASSLSIALENIQVSEACGVENGRIELNMSANPRFPVYDVEVVLDLDADSNLLASFEYLTNSTAFSGLYDLSGTPLAATNPAVSGNQLTWSLGDLRTNGQTMAITYRLQASCDADSNGQMRAFVRYNNRCSDGIAPAAFTASSTTNDNPYFFAGLLDNSIEPELTFLVSTQYVVRLDFLNSGFGSIYNLRAEILLPPNVVFGGAAIAPSFVSATNVVWDFQIASPFPGLVDRDSDGFYDDLLFGSPFSFWVTNYLTDCTGGSGISLSSSHGCGGEVCEVALADTATFTSSKGALVTRATFPDIETLCATNEVIYSVRNSGLTMDYNVQAYQTLPLGMTYVSGSSRVSLNNGPTNSIADPPGDGSDTNPLTWTSAEIPSLIALNPNDQVTILYKVFLGCEASMGDDQFISNGRFTDNCGLVQSNRDVISVLAVNEPLLQVTKSSLLVAADLNVTNVYTIVVSHDALSAADVPSMELIDVLPSAVTFLGASPAPDAVVGQTLIWSNNTLMSLVGDGSAPFTVAESFITIVVTGRVNSCAASVINSATVNYGCSVSNLCMTANDDASLITDPVLNPPGLVASLQLNTCGGTKTVSVTNRGATAHGMVMTETAPPGYVFVSASVTGEFNSAAVNLVLSGTPLGRTGTINFVTAAASGATDVDDDRGDGLGNLDFGYNNGYTITYVLASDGTELDCLADPTDLDFTDPEQGDPTSRSSSNVLTYSNLCGEAGSVGGSASAYPDIPDPDIDLQPNSLIVTNGQVVTNITATIRNNAEVGFAENLHVRLRFGMGWTNVVLVSSNIVSSGTTNMIVEIQGTTNVLVDLPGVILDPVDDKVVLVFQATTTTNGGSLDVLAEVVGDCDDAAVSPSCVFTNTWGLAPLADTMSGVIPAVNGQYYGFDQDRFVAAGLTITKTVRYDDEAPAAAGLSRTARVGEDLIYRIEATYFGGTFSNVTITESLPAQLLFRDPTGYAFSGSITGVVYDAGTGVFTLQPVVWSINPSTFAVDLPVVVSNRLDVQNGVVITNAVVTDYFLDGVTNDPTPHYTEVTVLEPNLVLTKSVNSNLVQSGDIVIFTNRVTHTGLSTTSAYDLVFTDTLPNGLTFSGLSLTSDGMDNDGDAVIDELDEGTLVSGGTFTVTTNQNIFLGELAISNTVFFRFPALVTNQIIGATIVNTSRVTWTSLDGVATNLNERDGSGGVNDYVTNSTAVFASKALGGLTKSFISSSQTNTLDGATNVFTIGERMIYSIRVDLPHGIATNVRITEIVPQGMDWVGGNTNSGLAYPGFGYQFTVPAGGPAFPTTTVEGLVITDPDPTPTNSLTFDGSGSNIVFRFGAITNTPDGDAGNDYFTLSMEFAILNQSTNDGLLPGIYTNRNRAQVQDGYTTYTVTSAVFSIAEHDLTLTKLISPAILDASNTVTVTLIVSNRPQALANAYDIVIDDFLSNRVFDVGTLNVTFLPDGWSYSSNVAAQGMTHSLFTTNTTALVPGSAVTNRFTIQIAQGVVPNAVYTNRAFVTASDTIYGNPPGGIPFRSDLTNALRTLQITNFMIAKSLESTSETNNPPDSTNNLVQIGETVTYRVSVTLPEATITNLAIADLVPTNGIAYIRNSARVDTNTFAGVLGTLAETPTGSGLLATNGQAITFTFAGNTFVWGDNDPANNTFHLLLDVLVLDTNFNAGFVTGQQTVHTNRATVTFTGNRLASVTSGVVTTTLIEPRLGIRKNIVQTDVDAGDVVDIQLTVTNSGLATAYDLTVTDPLNSFYFDPGSVANFTGPTGYTYSVVGTNLVILSDTNAVTGTNTLEAGESLFFTFQVTMAGTLPPNSTVTNWAFVSGDTLRSTNIFAVQRTYVTNGFDSVRAGDFSVLKTLYATSETGPVDSTNANLQIGEVATWRLQTVLPEGTVSNLTFTDLLPTGLQYVANSLVVDTNDFYGTLAPTTNITVSVGQIQFVFLGDTVVTADNNPANNVLRIRFDSVVLNTNWITGLPPQTVLTNRATVTYANNPSSPATSDVVVVRAVEPSLQIRKDIDLVSGDAGDLATITLVATNSGLATAYDVEVSDFLSGRMFDMGSVTHISMPAGYVFSVVTSAPNATVYYRSDAAGSGQPTNSLEAGESLTFVFTVPLGQSVEPGVAYTNVVTMTADTIDDTNYVGIQRFYTNTAQDSVSISNMTVAKALSGTSENGPADTVGARVTIGERALYVLYVTLPESTVTNLVVNDLLPVGMACVTSSVSVDVTGFGGSLPGAPTVSSNVSFLFSGLTVVSNNNDGVDNTFQIVFEAVVRDVASNDGLPVAVDGDDVHVLTNVATVAYDGYPPAATSEIRRVDVQEPSLLIRKTMSGPSNGLVNVDLVVTNRGLATAFDVVLTDVFPTNWWNTASITGTAPTGFVFTVTNAPGTGYLTILSDTNYAQPTNSIEVGESLTFRFTGEILSSARGVITNTAVVDIYTTIDGTNTDERFEPKTNSTALLPLPGYGLRKTLVGPTGRPAAVGETVVFNIVVTNNGSMGLNPVRVDDTFDPIYLSFSSAVPAVNGSGAGSVYWTNVGPLAIGSTTTLVVNFTALVSTLPDDTTNVALSTVFTTNGLPLLPQTSSAPVRVAAPEYVLQKTLLSPTGRPAVVGETVEFRIAVTNTGDIFLDTVRIDDTFNTNYLSFSGANPAPDAQGVGSLTWLNVGPLNVGGYTALTARYTAVRSTLPGDTTNRALSTITTTNGVPVPPQTSSVPKQIAAPAYLLDKVLVIPTNGVTTIGQPVTFRITVTNTGDVALDTVRIDDTFNVTDLSFVSATPAEDLVLGNQITWSNLGPLAIGGTTVITSRFTSLRSTVPGDTTNIAASAVSTTNGLPIPNQTNDATARVVDPGISLTKLAGNAPDGGIEYVLSGSDVVFTYIITNTGDTYLAGIVVTDNVLGAVGTITGLAPSASATLYTTSAVSANVTNLGVVIGNPAATNWVPLGIPPVTDDDDAIVDVVGPAIRLVKTAGSAPDGDILYVKPGSNVVYTYRVVNVGNTYLTNVVVTDNVLGVVGTLPSVLAPNQTNFLYATNFSITANVTNLGVVVGTPSFPNGLPIPDLPPVTWDDDAEVRTASPGYTLAKVQTSPGLRPAIIGETVTFRIRVVNTGDVLLVTVPLTDTFETNYLRYDTAVALPDATGVGTLSWTNIGPLVPRTTADVSVSFIALKDTLDEPRTNIVTTSPTTPTNYPPVPPATTGALYWINSPARIGDFVWEDVDADGLQGGGETGVVGVTVRLYDNQTNLIATTATDATGFYEFTNLYPWAYFVEFVRPAGYELTLRDVGGDNAIDSDPDRTTGRTVQFIVTSGSDNPTWDAGLFRRSSLGDFVWHDVDADGIQDAGETGLVNAVVTLLDPFSTVVGVTTTDVNGAYAFTNLVPGNYVINVSGLTGYFISPQDVGADDAEDSDISPITGDTVPFFLGSAETNLTLDAGLFLPASLGDFAWEDTNGNGVQDVGEPGLSNVVVWLYDAGDVIVGVATTDVNGAYAFTNLAPGGYFVEFEAPSGYQFARQDIGSDLTDSDADRVTGRTILTVLISGENDPTWDAGLYRPVSLGDFVWNDLDANGLQDGGEAGVSAVVVTLYDTNDVVVGITTTSVSGAYGFTNLFPGGYYVGVTVPAGWYVSPQDQGGDDTVDSDIDTSTGQTAVTNLVSGQTDLTLDGGLYLPASMGDYAWEDTNGNGVQDGGEPAMTNVTVRLYDGQTNLVDTTATDSSGAYAFTNLVPGVYFVEFVSPAGYQFALQDVGSDLADSDADRVTGRTIPTTLISGENDPTWDAGLYRPASLGDFIWHDLDADGIQDGSETGLVDIVVELYLTNGTFVGSVTTDVNGVYLFTNLPPDSYYVDVAVPAGWFTSPPNQGGDAALDSDIDSSGSTSGRTLLSGDAYLTLDGGLYLPARIGDTVWEDADRDGVQDGGEPVMTNVTVRLYDADTNLVLTTVTDTSGFYEFTNLTPSVYFLEFVLPAGHEFTLQDQVGDDTLDSDADVTTGWTVPTTLISGEDDPTWDAGMLRRAALGDFVWLDLDADGVQDLGEIGLTNVTVRLYDADTNLITSTVTDSAGAYLFLNLLPGTYLVEFVLPAGYNLSAADQGADDAADSDAAMDGFAPPVTLVSGEYNLSIDAGLYVYAELGNFVWEDMNGDGVQGAGEAGVAGVTVMLYDGVGGLVASTTTDVSGLYLFTNLVPNTYYVNFTLPSGYTFTLADQGGDDATDSDADTGTGNSGNYTLVSGQSDLSVDAGLYQPASIGNRIWEDMDYDAIQDTNELYSSAVTGLVVRLYTSNSILYATTQTDTNGYYLFGNLPPGGYFVEFTAPTTHVFVLANQGTNDLTDSDASPTNGRAAATFLSSGENDLSWDAGIIGFGIIGDHVWIDVNNNGEHDENLAIWGINGVRVYLYRVSGGVTSYVAMTTTATDLSGKKGFYEFRGLAFGEYLVVVELADIPPKLTIKTTVLSYRVRLRPEYAYYDADFGFNGLATPVELRWFKAERGPAGVLVSWATAVEVDNQGFNILRATVVDGERVRMNAGLIAGEGTSSGRTYDWTDVSADAGTTYYWLEDVSFDGVTELHGPAVVMAEGANEEDETLATFGVEQGMTLYRITQETLAEAGLGAVDPTRVMVKVGGEPVAVYVSSSEAVMQPTDYILFYAPEGSEEEPFEVAESTNAAAWQMEPVYAGPSGEGDVWYGVAADGQLAFTVTPALTQYLLIGFPGFNVAVLDVTEARRPKLLYGYGWMNTAMGIGLYLGYATEAPAQCLAVSDVLVTDVESVTKP